MVQQKNFRAKLPVRMFEWLFRAAQIGAAAALFLACGGQRPAAEPSAPAVANTPVVAPSPPVVPGLLSCVQPPAEGHDDQAPWSVKLGERLNEKAAQLAHCTGQLPVGESDLIVRLVYAGDGSPMSAHVARASAASCAVSQCIVDGLVDVWGPKKANIDPLSYDFSLVVRRGEAPQWTGELVDPLMPEATDASCVDPQIRQLSKKRVYETISTTFTELKKCHMRAVERDRTAVGLVTFEFVIGPSGKVATTRARDSTLYDCEAIECMKEQFGSLSFAPPVGRSVPVIFPVEFAIDQDSVAFR